MARAEPIPAAGPGPLAPEAEQAVAGLLAAAGFGPRYRATRLPAGGNNRVYRLDVEGAAAPLALKAYYHHPDDPRDRLGAEFAFSERAWRLGLRCLPEPLARDGAAHLGLYGFVEGRALAAEDLAPELVEAALRLCVEVNRGREDARALPEASEACFSIADHLATVERRLARLGGLDRGEPLRASALDLLTDRVEPRYATLKAGALDGLATLGIDFDRPIPAQARCLSPSDFGFHNALLRADGSVAFLDFEYAGWDDPANLVCDLFSQVAFPLPMVYYRGFADGLAEALELTPAHRRSFDLLLPLYRIKWICLVLQNFLPAIQRRRAFAGGEAALAGRLRLAEALVARLETEPLP